MLKRLSFRFFLILLLAATLIALWILGPSEATLFAAVKLHLEPLRAFNLLHPLLFALSFFLFYAAVTSFVPLGLVLMLLAGAIFPVWLGSLIVCTGYSVGATLNFFIARYFLQDRVPAKLQGLRNAVERDGWFYLFVLRLIPFLPAQGISFAMGATPIAPLPFFTATWAGDLPLSIFIVYMGRRLAQIDSLRGLLSPDIMLGLTGFALFLLAAKWWIGRQRELRAITEEVPTL